MLGTNLSSYKGQSFRLDNIGDRGSKKLSHPLFLVELYFEETLIQFTLHNHQFKGDLSCLCNWMAGRALHDSSVLPCSNNLLLPKNSSQTCGKFCCEQEIHIHPTNYIKTQGKSIFLSNNKCNHFSVLYIKVSCKALYTSAVQKQQGTVPVLTQFSWISSNKQD